MNRKGNARGYYEGYYGPMVLLLTRRVRAYYPRGSRYWDLIYPARVSPCGNVVGVSCGDASYRGQCARGRSFLRFVLVGLRPIYGCGANASRYDVSKDSQACSGASRYRYCASTSRYLGARVMSDN